MGRPEQRETAQGLPILGLTLRGRGTTVATMGNGFVDAVSRCKRDSDHKELTPLTLEADNLRRVMILGGWSVGQDWEDSDWNGNIIPGCMISERPEEAEELGSLLTNCVGSERSKGQALFVIFGGAEFTFILLHGLQSAPRFKTWRLV